MALLREPGATAVAQFGVPVRGTWRSLAVHGIPENSLYDSLNVFIRKGKLRNRPGLSLLNSTVFDNPIMGATMVVTPLDKIIIALTSTGLYELSENDSNWNKTSPLPYIGDEPIDIATLETSSMYVALIARPNYTLSRWNGTLHNFAEVTPSLGTVPRAKSVCIAGRRVIALIPPHTIVWSATGDHTSWSALSTNRLAQSGDVGICVRSLGTLSFVVYKERSLYTARSQAGSDATAFSFGEPIYVEGPASVHAVVNVGGVHIYMTKNGRVFMFDGARYPTPILDGLWLFLQDDIDPVWSRFIFGVFDYRLHTVTFYYARRGDGLRMQGMVIINMPYQGMDIAEQGIAQPTGFFGVSNVPCSMGCEMRFDRGIDRSLLFSSTEESAQSFISDESVKTDNNSEYQCSFQTPLVAMPNAQHQQVTVEPFFERGFGNGAVTIEAVTSDLLETEDGTVIDGNGQVINLETNPVQEHIGFNIPARFFGLRCSWRSTNTVHYAGAVVHGRPLGKR